MNMSESFHGIRSLIEIRAVTGKMTALMQERDLTFQYLGIRIIPEHVIVQFICMQKIYAVTMRAFSGMLLWSLHGLHQTKPKQAGEKNQKISKYHFWQDGCYTEVISSLKFFKQKLDYIHQNPVRAEFVRYPQDYLYSSAIDYAGGRGLLEVIVVR